MPWLSSRPHLPSSCIKWLLAPQAHPICTAAAAAAPLAGSAPVLAHTASIQLLSCCSRAHQQRAGEGCLQRFACKRQPPVAGPANSSSCACAGGDGGALSVITPGTAKFVNCEFYDNTAEWANGGAISSTGAMGRGWKGSLPTSAGVGVGLQARTGSV